MEELREMDEYNMSGRCVVPELLELQRGKKNYCSEFLGRKLWSRAARRETNPHAL
jgi:hypothetical protein